METYTPSQGTTQQGQQQSNMQQLLQTIQNMPASSVPPVTPNQVAQTQSNAFNFQQQIPALTQQSQQSLTQQSGIPNLQNQQQNLGQIFQLYLHDQNLGQKYASTQLSTPNSPVFNSNLQPNQGIYTGETSAVPNPYLASTKDLINAVVQPSGQGFQGFTNPNLNTQAIGEVPSAAQNMIQLLNNAIGTEQGLVTQKTGDASANYQTALNTLLGIANIFSQTYQNQQAAKSGSGSGVGSSQYAATQYQTLRDNFVSQMQAQGKTPTWDGFWYFLNSQKNSLAAQGVDVAELYKLQAQDRSEFGGTGDVTSGAKGMTKSQAGKTTVTAVPSTKTNPNPGSKVKLSNGSTILVKPTTSGGILGIGATTSKPKESVQQVINDAQSAGLSDLEMIQALKSMGYTVIQ